MVPLLSADGCSLIDRRRFLTSVAVFGAALRPYGVGAATPLRVGYVPVIGAAALVVFARSGMAREAGLDLALVKLDPGRPTLPTGDGLDAVAAGVAPIARAKAEGADIAIVSGLATAGAGFVAVPDLAARFNESAGDPAKALAAFKEKFRRKARLGTSPRGAAPSTLLHHWLFALHAVPNDAAEIVVMDLPALRTAIGAGTIDGATLPEPASTVLRTREPRLQRIVSGAAMFPDMPGIVLGAFGRFSKGQPAACRALVAGIVGATRLVRDQPADAAPLVAAALDVAPPDRELVTRALTSSNIGFVTDPRTVAEPARRLLAYETILGDFPVPPATSGLIDASFYRR